MTENNENNNNHPKPDKTIKTESHFEKPPKVNRKIVAQTTQSADQNNEK